MLDLAKNEGPKPKCFFTHAALPSYIDPSQPPSIKKRPFSTIATQPFSHILDVILPSEDAKSLTDALADNRGTLHYARVYMKLGDVLEGDFFNHYIKSGNILMLSEGRSGIDHIYSLKDGVLRLEIDKPTYERTGLQGEVMPSLGRKHVKARFAIEVNLRLPSMIRGKPAFERLLWAARNVLSRSVAWLFIDLKSPTDGTGPIAAHQPLLKKVEPKSEHLEGVLVPHFPEALEQDDYLDATEVLEWLTMIGNASPRIQDRDRIDPYLCRYQVPNFVEDEETPQETQDLTILRWHGFISANFVSKIFLAALKASSNKWLAMSATSFHGETYTVLRTGDRTLIWQYMD